MVQPVRRFKPFIIALILILVAQSIFYPGVVDAAGKMPKGSKIGDVTVSGKTDDEIKTLLDTEIATWLAGDDFVLRSDSEYFYVPRDVVKFDVNASIEDLNNKTKRTWETFFLRPKNKSVDLQVSLNKESDTYKQLVAAEYINVDATLARMVEHAKQLAVAEIPIVYSEDVEGSAETLAGTTYDIPKLSNSTLKYIVDALDDYTIDANTPFHLTDAINLPEDLEEPEEELSFVATALYNAFLLTDFEIAERHTQIDMPNYTTYGRDVLVDPEADKDFIAFNVSDHPYTISMEIKDGELHTAFMSLPSNITYGFSIENDREIEPRTFYRFDHDISVGTFQVDVPGEAGRVVEVYRITYEGEKEIDKELISIDVYLPTTEIILISPDEEIQSF